MIFAFEKYCITREHFLKMTTLYQHAVTVVIAAIQVSAATTTDDGSWCAYTSGDHIFGYDKPTSVLQDTVYDLLTKY